MRSLVRKYLEEMRELFTYLSNDGGSGFFTPYSTIPLFVLVFITATASSINTCIIGVLSSLALLVYALTSTSVNHYHVMLKTITVISVMVLVISTPAIIVYGLDSVYMFIARTLSSTIVFTSMLYVTGWWNIIRGLRIVKTPGMIIELVYQTIKFIPLFLNESLKLLSAREARVLERTSTTNTWRLLSNIVAELVIKAYHRSLTMNMALNARTLSTNKYVVGSEVTRPTTYDLYLILVTLTILLYEVMCRIWNGQS